MLEGLEHTAGEGHSARAVGIREHYTELITPGGDVVATLFQKVHQQAAGLWVVFDNKRFHRSLRSSINGAFSSFNDKHFCHSKQCELGHLLPLEACCYPKCVFLFQSGPTYAPPQVHRSSLTFRPLCVYY